MTGRNLPKTYDPNETEPRIYQFWLERGYFAPRTIPQTAGSPKEPFVITLPPPNITGELHVGHALCYLAQDIAGRRARMQGRPTLLLPGMDHAGIATQNVVERQLAAEGRSRHELGRERFEARCWAFVNETMPVIRRQFQRLGFSFDWSRERFTLDEGYRRAVNRAFAHFFRQGWIYRGDRLINWCPRCATSISDLEVEHVTREDTLYTLAYAVRDTERTIRVATTRPETMLGDTAVAVHPDDDRYARLVGRTALLPLIGRPLPIVADPAVDPDFGTGAVKVTPAHDPVDQELGQRHGLETVNVIGEDGRMTEAAGPYAGMMTSECRQVLLRALEKEGRLIDQAPYVHSVGTCERCHTVIEPLISRQWFMEMETLAAPALEAVRSGRVRIQPEQWARVYEQWMENIEDWCISRQLWWGHRIPVWRCGDCGGYSTLTENETAPTACERCGGKELAQETDVLDTWFSSALWPFASLGWPDETEDLRRYYPGHFLGTAGEIIFLWVARMIMEGLAFMGQVPFDRVYINPTVLAHDGRRMSKSLGTGVDPLIACETYGADAIRWALIRDNTLAQTVRFSEERADEGRRFANKLWNAARFTLSKLARPAEAPADAAADLPLPERWIRSRLNRAIAACDAAHDGLRFDQASQTLYEFIWGAYCDWYLEIAKHRLHRPETLDTLRHCLDGALRLLHPLMPHVTEEIWGYLTAGQGPALITARWPEPGAPDEDAEEKMVRLVDLVQSIRHARSAQRIPAGQHSPATIVAEGGTTLLTDNLDWLAPLARLDPNRLEVRSTHQKDQRLTDYTTVGSGPFTCHLPLLDPEAERERLESELDDLVARIARSEDLLAGEFRRRAPAEIVAREQDKLKALRQQRAELCRRLARYQTGEPSTTRPER